MSYFAQEPDLILLSLSFSNLEDGGGWGTWGWGRGKKRGGIPKVGSQESRARQEAAALAVKAGLSASTIAV